MGGIPYTSTGCNTCRRRKVKCDETKPECLRCTKYGHQCTGYDRKKALVRDHTGSAPKKAQRIIPISERASVDGMEIVPRQNLNPELRTQLIATFIESYLPSSPYLPNSTGLNVIQSIPELTGVSTMLEKAVISFSAVHLAKQNHDDRLLHYSSKLYGITLRTLNSRLRVGSKLDQDILYTTVILQFYEMIHCSPSGFMAWIAHVQGSLAVLGQYSGLGKGTAIEKLFHRQLKYVTICDAVVKRKAPYLYKTPAWRGLSSQGDTEPDPLDEFIDQLAECSALLERVDRFFHMQSISSEKANESGDQLLLACLSFEDNLHRLCLSMQGKLGLPMTSSHVATRGDFQDSLHTDLFCGILDFPSLPCAESHLLYWAILFISTAIHRAGKQPLQSPWFSTSYNQI
ncbi:hypothetical protein BJX61DRAFT_21651 [Aspergillus egyptiacus]|nr:hypothetical protein BJX61DRAFT_21651 [Aspergillus egyptiacus]